ncbi:MAG: SDR family NAD(P)-dependent oxidoreductase, partial [Aeromonas veronii]
PGTVDTQLSRPFHANVPAGNVQSPELVADHLINLMNRLQPDGELSFLDWQGKPIEW